MPPGPTEVEEVLVGAGGALAAMERGSLVIDMSTGSPAVARRLADAGSGRGIAVLDAPVADALRASEGMLHIFVGGDAGDLERARPLLEVIGDPDRVVHVGPHGAGQATKLPGTFSGSFMPSRRRKR
jgi:3-hydroxyisobutyrate dehydrogenase